jgi:hypothetical protein
MNDETGRGQTIPKINLHKHDDTDDNDERSGGTTLGSIPSPGGGRRRSMRRLHPRQRSLHVTAVD